MRNHNEGNIANNEKALKESEKCSYPVVKEAIRFFSALLIPVVLAAAVVVVVDPFFHYHAPLKGVPYVLTEERYQNDGIVKHYEYEALITGSSTSQNFKASDVSRLWGFEAVKVPFAGATFKEQDNLIRTAVSSNPNLKIVIRGIDANRINSDKDEMGYVDYPEYIYDNNPLNDFDYLFNKDVAEIIGKAAIRLVKGEPAMSFDEYSNWNGAASFGKEAVLSTFTRVNEAAGQDVPYTEEDYTRIRENITQNIIETAKENPDVEFYVFLTPPSVYFWDAIIRTGSYDNVIEQIRYTYELLVEVDNIKLFSFFDKIDITGNPDNYMDTLHYGEDINTYMCECMKRGEGLMTKENYEEHMEKVREIYETFDYDSVF